MELGLFILGCFIGGFIGLVFATACYSASRYDREFEQDVHERHRREKDYRW